MTTTTQPNGLAPTAGTYRLGGKGGRMADAWQMIWNQLGSSPKDATELADAASAATGLKHVSVISHMHRMAKDGHIVGEVRSVPVEVTRTYQTKDGEPVERTFTATRKRTFYRLPS